MARREWKPGQKLTKAQTLHPETKNLRDAAYSKVRPLDMELDQNERQDSLLGYIGLTQEQWDALEEEEKKDIQEFFISAFADYYIHKSMDPEKRKDYEKIMRAIPRSVTRALAITPYEEGVSPSRKLHGRDIAVDMRLRIQGIFSRYVYIPPKRGLRPSSQWNTNYAQLRNAVVEYVLAQHSENPFSNEEAQKRIQDIEILKQALVDTTTDVFVDDDEFSSYHDGIHYLQKRKQFHGDFARPIITTGTPDETYYSRESWREELYVNLFELPAEDDDKNTPTSLEEKMKHYEITLANRLLNNRRYYGTANDDRRLKYYFKHLTNKTRPPEYLDLAKKVFDPAQADNPRLLLDEVLAVIRMRPKTSEEDALKVDELATEIALK